MTSALWTAENISAPARAIIAGSEGTSATFRLQNAPRTRVDTVTGTEVRTRPDGMVEVRYVDGTVDFIDKR